MNTWYKSVCIINRQLLVLKLILSLILFFFLSFRYTFPSFYNTPLFMLIRVWLFSAELINYGGTGDVIACRQYINVELQKNSKETTLMSYQVRIVISRRWLLNRRIFCNGFIAARQKEEFCGSSACCYKSLSHDFFSFLKNVFQVFKQINDKKYIKIFGTSHCEVL